MSEHSRISIFMPAYNAALQIEGVLDRIPAGLLDKLTAIWIINDGSTDKTGQIIDNLAKKDPIIKPVHFERNRGYGEAVRKGLALCIEDGCDYAVCLHSDGQYPPESIAQFVKFMKENSVELCQGSRIASGTALSGGMPLYKFVAGKILTFFENYAFGLHMTDYHSGFLVYSKKVLSAVPFEKLSKSFDFDLEVIATARSINLKVGELPIPTRYADEVSHLNPIVYGLRVLKVIIKYLFGYYKFARKTDAEIE